MCRVFGNRETCEVEDIEAAQGDSTFENVAHLVNRQQGWVVKEERHTSNGI